MNLVNDLRYALRQLRRSPAFAITAVVTLALGIGATTAMFSVIDQVLLRPLPYQDPSRLVAITESVYGQNPDNPGIPLPDAQDWQTRSHALQSIAFYTFQQPTVGGIDVPQTAPQLLVSPNFFQMLGIEPALGRSFLPKENAAGESPVVILGAELWHTLFHADPHIVGRAIPLNGTLHTVVGVLPEDFSFRGGSGVMFSPLATNDKELQDRGSGVLTVLGRLRPGATVQAAVKELNGIKQQDLRAYPGKERDTRVVVQSYARSLTANVRPALLALNGSVWIVWLIACVNVAGLLMTRSSGRRREIAVRGTLGAGGARLLQQFLTESLVLSLAGGALGLAIAAGALRLSRHYLSSMFQNGENIHIDAAVCLYLLIASCLSALIFGVIPAWQAAHAPLQEGLREGSTASGTSHRQKLLRDALVTAEIALSLVLLVAAGLMMRSLYTLRHTPLGFAPEHVMTADLVLPQKNYWFVTAGPGSGANIVQTFVEPMLDRICQLPGVSYAGVTTVRPLKPSWSFVDDIAIAGRPKPDARHAQQADVRAATASYFPAMGIRLLRGRLFNSEDGAGAPLAVVINQTFATRFFGAESPLGHQVNASDRGPHKLATIVGVVDDARQGSAAEAARPEMVFNLNQMTPADDLYPILAAFHADLVVRTRSAPATLIPAITRIVHALNPAVAFDNAQTMNEVVDDAMGSQTLAARLLGLFAAIALGIAAAGIYGLLAYQVSQRTRELGVRLALGAQRKDVLWLVLRHALTLLTIGVGAGMALAFSLSRVIGRLMYGVQTHDAVFVVEAVTIVLGLCCLLASYLPARRAASIDPVQALRAE
ncbi:MAG: ABC transporter permease [Acidobacteriaceae bacterium]